MTTTKEQAKNAYDSLANAWHGDEHKYYSEQFDCENPHEVATDELNECNYKDLRVLEDYFYEKKKICCICENEYSGYGNNPKPYKNDGRCCDECNINQVLPQRWTDSAVAAAAAGKASFQDEK